MLREPCTNSTEKANGKLRWKLFRLTLRCRTERSVGMKAAQRAAQPGTVSR